jgi:hypothetical protein
VEGGGGERWREIQGDAPAVEDLAGAHRRNNEDTTASAQREGRAGRQAGVGVGGSQQPEEI